MDGGVVDLLRCLRAAPGDEILLELVLVEAGVVELGVIVRRAPVGHQVGHQLAVGRAVLHPHRDIVPEAAHRAALAEGRAAVGGHLQQAVEGAALVIAALFPAAATLLTLAPAAAFATTFPVLNTLNVMQLATPQSAVLSAVIFNALIIIALIPLALRGIKYRPVGAELLLRRHLLIYGLGGILVPFIGIKLIDMMLVALHLV